MIFSTRDCDYDDGDREDLAAAEARIGALVRLRRRWLYEQDHDLARAEFAHGLAVDDLIHIHGCTFAPAPEELLDQVIREYTLPLEFDPDDYGSDELFLVTAGLAGIVTERWRRLQEDAPALHRHHLNPAVVARKLMFDHGFIQGPVPDSLLDPLILAHARFIAGGESGEAA